MKRIVKWNIEFEFKAIIWRLMIWSMTEWNSLYNSNSLIFLMLVPTMDLFHLIGFNHRAVIITQRPHSWKQISLNCCWQLGGNCLDISPLKASLNNTVLSCVLQLFNLHIRRMVPAWYYYQTIVQFIRQFFYYS